MGYGVTDGEARAKRIYSLAYNRASASLRKRHLEEFNQLLEVHRNNIIAEEVMTGSVLTERSGGGPKHREGDEGTCVFCGETSPCTGEKKRIARQRLKESRRREVA